MIINDNGTEREATKTEIAYYAAWQKDIETSRAAQAEALQAKAEAKASALAKLNLTADEAAALFG